MQPKSWIIAATEDLWWHLWDRISAINALYALFQLFKNLRFLLRPSFLGALSWGPYALRGLGPLALRQNHQDPRSHVEKQHNCEVFITNVESISHECVLAKWTCTATAMGATATASRAQKSLLPSAQTWLKVATIGFVRNSKDILLTIHLKNRQSFDESDNASHERALHRRDQAEAQEYAGSSPIPFACALVHFTFATTAAAATAPGSGICRGKVPLQQHYQSCPRPLERFPWIFTASCAVGHACMQQQQQQAQQQEQHNPRLYPQEWQFRG